jgi:ATP-dependent Lon protease
MTQSFEPPLESDDDSTGSPDPSVSMEEFLRVATEPSVPSPPDEPVIPEALPVLPIRDSVVFPGTVMPLAVEREKSKRVLDLALAGSRIIAVVAQRFAETEDPRLDDLYRVGTACVLLKKLKGQDGTHQIIVHGLRRVGIEAITRESDYLEAKVHTHVDSAEVTQEQNALMHTLRVHTRRVLEISMTSPEAAVDVLREIEQPGLLSDFVAANLPLRFIYKQELLETFDVTERLKKLNLAVAAHLDMLELSNKIQSQVRDQVDKSQREYYLREQLKAIQQELGETDHERAGLVLLRERLKAAKLPPAAETEAQRELERMERIPQASPEYSMALDYLEWLASLPWSVGTNDVLDIHRAERILNEDHYGLTKVKNRILEFLAVRTLKSDSRGPILCLAGPPGVGKTSLGQSIARALGRNFIRISLGGIHDEATIRGHRRTYIGAMPGRIIREIRRAGSNNPLFMLDEVDKITQDVHGDPMSALLEVLDPAQNSSFSDHYLAVPYDLSKVLFIATANYMSAIEPALRDRMEVIEISSYTHVEKLHIARRHLIPRQLNENGFAAEPPEFPDDVLSLLIADYTREAGVRSLERKIAALCRARAASKIRGDAIPPALSATEVQRVLGPREFESEIAAASAVPGVVTGLAFTPAGGEILFIEANLVPGTGQLRMTGQIGDVMRESAVAASSIVRGHFRQWKIPRDLYQTTDLHIHVPAGAIPKDGPSAGVAILAALVSVMTDVTVDPALAMTGEITLSGRVLPVGGITEKILAAHRAGIKTVVLPARNRPQVDEVPAEVREQISFVYIHSIDDLFGRVLDVRGRRTASKGKKRRAPAPARSARSPRAASTGQKPRIRGPRSTGAKPAQERGASASTRPRRGAKATRAARPRAR